ncbi:MAG TPA: hypothetical protein ENN21_02455 [Spirochaetes bacterium]|nr:hypothetical protein [Spirochaetota bacterium]
MNDFTIISYPSARDDVLLSLADGRSRYMIPFGGRFRIVDFTIRNSTAAGASRTIIYSNIEDRLGEYVDHYGPFKGKHFPAIKVVSRNFSDIRLCYNLIMDSNSDFYIIYNGDHPSIIDFKDLVERYRRKRAQSLLFTLKMGGKGSMAYPILITRQKSLLAVVNQAIDENRDSPNLFEMIINILINTGIARETLSLHYWPLKSVPDYYHYNMELMKSKKLATFVFGDGAMKSFIGEPSIARVGRYAKINNSFISEGCDINGTVQNSIIFPGVVIGEKALVKDSIILPGVRIGAASRVLMSVVDERTAPPGEGEEDGGPPTVGERCYVGSDQAQLKNNDFPKSIHKSITLLGRDCVIPDGSHIGAACYVAPGLGGEYFAKKKYLYDGLSLVE